MTEISFERHAVDTLLASVFTEAPVPEISAKEYRVLFDSFYRLEEIISKLQPTHVQILSGSSSFQAELFGSFQRLALLAEEISGPNEFGFGYRFSEFGTAFSEFCSLAVEGNAGLPRRLALSNVDLQSRSLLLSIDNEAVKDDLVQRLDVKHAVEQASVIDPVKIPDPILSAVAKPTFAVGISNLTETTKESTESVPAPFWISTEDAAKRVFREKIEVPVEPIEHFEESDVPRVMPTGAKKGLLGLLSPFFRDSTETFQAQEGNQEGENLLTPTKGRYKPKLDILNPPPEASISTKTQPSAHQEENPQVQPPVDNLANNLRADQIVPQPIVNRQVHPPLEEPQRPPSRALAVFDSAIEATGNFFNSIKKVMLPVTIVGVVGVGIWKLLPVFNAPHSDSEGSVPPVTRDINSNNQPQVTEPGSQNTQPEVKSEGNQQNSPEGTPRQQRPESGGSKTEPDNNSNTAPQSARNKEETTSTSNENSQQNSQQQIPEQNNSEQQAETNKEKAPGNENLLLTIGKIVGGVTLGSGVLLVLVASRKRIADSISRLVSKRRTAPQADPAVAENAPIENQQAPEEGVDQVVEPTAAAADEAQTPAVPDAAPVENIPAAKTLSTALSTLKAQSGGLAKPVGEQLSKAKKAVQAAPRTIKSAAAAVVASIEKGIATSVDAGKGAWDKTRKRIHDGVRALAGYSGRESNDRLVQNEDWLSKEFEHPFLQDANRRSSLTDNQFGLVSIKGRFEEKAWIIETLIPDVSGNKVSSLRYAAENREDSLKKLFIKRSFPVSKNAFHRAVEHSAVVTLPIYRGKNNLPTPLNSVILDCKLLDANGDELSTEQEVIVEECILGGARLDAPAGAYFVKYVVVDRQHPDAVQIAERYAVTPEQVDILSVLCGKEEIVKTSNLRGEEVINQLEISAYEAANLLMIRAKSAGLKFASDPVLKQIARNYDAIDLQKIHTALQVADSMSFGKDLAQSLRAIGVAPVISVTLPVVAQKNPNTYRKRKHPGVSYLTSSQIVSKKTFEISHAEFSFTALNQDRQWERIGLSADKVEADIVMSSQKSLKFILAGKKLSDPLLEHLANNRKSIVSHTEQTDTAAVWIRKLTYFRMLGRMPSKGELFYNRSTANVWQSLFSSRFAQITWAFEALKFFNSWSHNSQIAVQGKSPKAIFEFFNSNQVVPRFKQFDIQVLPKVLEYQWERGDSSIEPRRFLASTLNTILMTTVDTKARERAFLQVIEQCEQRLGYSVKEDMLKNLSYLPHERIYANLNTGFPLETIVRTFKDLDFSGLPAEYIIRIVGIVAASLKLTDRLEVAQSVSFGVPNAFDCESPFEVCCQYAQLWSSLARSLKGLGTTIHFDLKFSVFCYLERILTKFQAESAGDESYSQITNELAFAIADVLQIGQPDAARVVVRRLAELSNNDQNPFVKLLNTPQGKIIFKDLIDENRLGGVGDSIAQAFFERLCRGPVGGFNDSVIKSLLENLYQSGLGDEKPQLVLHSKYLNTVAEWIDTAMTEIVENETFCNYPSSEHDVSTAVQKYIRRSATQGIFTYLDSLSMLSCIDSAVYKKTFKPEHAIAEAFVDGLTWTTSSLHSANLSQEGRLILDIEQNPVLGSMALKTKPQSLVLYQLLVQAGHIEIRDEHRELEKVVTVSDAVKKKFQSICTLAANNLATKIPWKMMPHISASARYEASVGELLYASNEDIRNQFRELTAKTADQLAEISLIDDKTKFLSSEIQFSEKLSRIFKLSDGYASHETLNALAYSLLSAYGDRSVTDVWERVKRQLDTSGIEGNFPIVSDEIVEKPVKNMASVWRTLLAHSITRAKVLQADGIKEELDYVDVLASELSHSSHVDVGENFIERPLGNFRGIRAIKEGEDASRINYIASYILRQTGESEDFVNIFQRHRSRSHHLLLDLELFGVPQTPGDVTTMWDDRFARDNLLTVKTLLNQLASQRVDVSLHFFARGYVTSIEHINGMLMNNELPFESKEFLTEFSLLMNQAKSLFGRESQIYDEQIQPGVDIFDEFDVSLEGGATAYFMLHPKNLARSQYFEHYLAQRGTSAVYIIS